MVYVSLPSKQVVSADTPEIDTFSAQFHYNFFVSDEKTNETGIMRNEDLRRPSEAYNAFFVTNVDFESLYPRYMILSWISPKKKTAEERLYLADSISIAENYDKIHFETDMVTENYSVLKNSNDNLNSDFSVYIKNAANALGVSSSGLSPQELSLAINKTTNENIKTDFVSDTLNSLQNYGYNFLDKTKKNTFFDLANEATPTIQINTKILSKFAGSMNFSTLNDPTEVQKNYEQSVSLEQNAINTFNSNIISSDEYDFVIRNVVTEKEIQTTHPSEDNITRQIVGYIIEKYEVDSSGSLLPKKSIIIENPQISDFYDTAVKYDASYVYQIRTVNYIETEILYPNGSCKIVGFLVASRPVGSGLVRCEEREPPPPPSDFNLRWDYAKKKLCLSWAFPPGAQRDVKYFQIFRRKTIQEPFQLVYMEDFDDSTIKTPLRETPSVDLITKTTNPLLFWFDNEFKKESTFIYAVCCQDAHGFTSNYSMQFEVSFDIFGNKLVKKLVSVAGAPKPYPNFFLNKDTFVDTIRDEQHSKIEVYFNPEYRTVKNYSGEDMGLLKTEEEDFYQLQLINIDFQQQQVLNIKLISRETKI